MAVREKKAREDTSNHGGEVGATPASARARRMIATDLSRTCVGVEAAFGVVRAFVGFSLALQFSACVFGSALCF